MSQPDYGYIWPISPSDGFRCATKSGAHKMVASANHVEFYCERCLVRTNRSGRILKCPSLEFHQERGMESMVNRLLGSED